MNCDRIEELLPDHAMGRLPAARGAQVADHLKACAACQVYLNGIEDLYEVPLPFAGSAPTEFHLPSTRKRSWRSLALAGGLVAAAAAAFLFINRAASPQSINPEATQRVRAHLASLAIELPELPSRGFGDGWIGSESEARLLSDYSGKPVLMQYINAECQRCLGVVQLMEEPEHELLLEEFICFRSEVEQGAPPAVLAGRAPEGQLMSSLPAMFVSAERCSTDPAMAISDWDDVEGVVADYATQCELRGVEIVRALEGGEFETALLQMRGLPRLMESGLYNEVLAELQSMGGLGERYRTRFAAEAQRMEQELLQGLEEVVCDLEALRESEDGPSAQSLAQDLLPSLTDTPFAQRIQVLCN